jgi:hypothetical protein
MIQINKATGAARDHHRFVGASDEVVCRRIKTSSCDYGPMI